MILILVFFFHWLLLVYFYTFGGIFCFFFFFQAEDGIRDGHVTEVQTCALPISGSHLRSWPQSEGPIVYSSAFQLPGSTTRSEERRVGKECSSQRWTIHTNK